MIISSARHFKHNASSSIFMRIRRKGETFRRTLAVAIFNKAQRRCCIEACRRPSRAAIRLLTLPCQVVVPLLCVSARRPWIGAGVCGHAEWLWAVLLSRRQVGMSCLRLNCHSQPESICWGQQGTNEHMRKEMLWVSTTISRGKSSSSSMTSFQGHTLLPLTPCQAPFHVYILETTPRTPVGPCYWGT